MFKLLKSKKGFTLVELMIVVVIMAILVAVAVPIFSAVTKNAEKRTCLANQREIQAQFSNNSMTDILKIKVGEVYTLTSNGDGDGGDWAASSGASAGSNIATIEELFQEVPYCPTENAVITVEVKTADLGSENTGNSLKIETKCSVSTHKSAS